VELHHPEVLDKISRTSLEKWINGKKGFKDPLF
jgi:hypothetical protein